MENYVYLIVLEGANGTQRVLSKVFKNLVSADRYAKSIHSISNPLCNGCFERIVRCNIIKAEVVR